MAKTVYIRTSLTGGGANDLDGIDGSGLADGDAAFIFNDADGKFYAYQLDATAGGSQNSPYTIQPQDNPGSKMWVLFQPYVEAAELESSSSSSESSASSSSSSLSSSSVSSSSASSSSSNGV
jgi:hypothetical protein